MQSLSHPSAQPSADRELSMSSRPKKGLPQGTSPNSRNAAPSFRFGYEAATAFNFTALSAALDEVERVKSGSSSAAPSMPELSNGSDQPSHKSFEDDEDELYLPPEVTGPLTQAELDAIEALDQLIASIPAFPPLTHTEWTSPEPMRVSLRQAHDRPESTRIHATDILLDDPEFEDIKLAAQTWKPGMISPLFNRPIKKLHPRGPFKMTPLAEQDVLALREQANRELSWSDEESEGENEHGRHVRQDETYFADLLHEVQAAAAALRERGQSGEVVGEVADVNAVWDRSAMLEEQP